MVSPVGSEEPRRGGPRLCLLFLLLTVLLPGGSVAQRSQTVFPRSHVLPVFLAGPREPVASGSLLAVSRNPNRFGPGVEAEVSLGNSLPLLLVLGDDPARPFLLGLEAAVYARFGLQILERELIATDWLFTVPMVWMRPGGWVRFRYYHSSSHLGDEYSRRFDDRGVDFSRDAVDFFAYSGLGEGGGVYGGVRFGYNVKPEESRRWVIRGGAQKEWPEEGQTLRPWVAADVEWDQDAGNPRLDVRMGTWLPVVDGRRRVRLSLGILLGPSPLGQFHGKPTLQTSVGLSGRL